MPDLFEVVLEQTYSNQLTINRWNYYATGTPATGTKSFTLFKQLGFQESAGSYPDGTFFAALRACQVNLVKGVQVRILNIYDLDDFYQTPFVPQPAGTFAGNGESPTLAVGWSSNQITRAIRRSTKRLVGVPQDGVSPGGGINSTLMDKMITAAAAMSAVQTPVDEGSTITYTPCTVGKEKYVVPGSIPPREAYRYYLPEDEATQFEHLAIGITWSPYVQTRTQTSRQYGRGM